MNTVAVYPGSFDPITNGHVDIVTRALAVFDRVIVGVLANPRKTPLLDAETRIAVIREALADAGPDGRQVEVKAFDGLTVDFCRAEVGGREFNGCIESIEVRIGNPKALHGYEIDLPNSQASTFVTPNTGSHSRVWE